MDEDHPRGPCESCCLLKNVHYQLAAPTDNGNSYLIRGDYTYYNYKCDGFDDIGWGCAYRTLQSTCSWISDALGQSAVEAAPPSIPDIQKTLVSISDKPQSFFGSREWIGALEVFYVIDTLYDIPCKILHIPECDGVKKYVGAVKKYFQDYGGLIMMGGDLDAASKGIAGVHVDGNEAYFLVIDPHYVGKPQTVEEIIDKGYVRWMHTKDFVDSSFYNLCMPQINAK